MKISLVAGVTWFALQSAMAQVSPSDTQAQLQKALQQIERLASKVEAQEARIRELEAARGAPAPAAPVTAAVQAAPPETQAVVKTEPAPAVPDVAQTQEIAQPQDTGMGHNMEIPGGGPVFNIRGFFDFNFGVGSIANPLVFPIVNDGCGTCGNPPTPPHTAFSAGEFDLFITSKLSDHLSFLSEVVLGPNATNLFGVDIERYVLTYRVNRYFSANAGRFHTSIGYYNTAFHHGTWFSTAEGRPIMYLFEDSGGILPVHMVGVNLDGEVPKTEKLGLHWVFEIGNGLSSFPNVAESVQNFYSDRNYKATNLAVFIRPQAVSGLQIGGSWYHDGLNPAGLPEIKQNIESAYVVYLTPNWEFFTEAVLLSNHFTGTSQSFRSPMAYTQLARAFGIYKPYFRYQYVRDNVNDPVNLLKGTYYGPSIGMRIDFATYAAFKLQFNHLFQSSQLAGNGLDAQIAFTF
ncbi:MAG: hypothetical protein ABSH09_08580 [Bryobacteraceae bacterium]|jgi:hypothetical protein